MSTRDTTKGCLIRAITALGMPADATALAGIRRINQRDRHTGTLCLVADTGAQLPESPVVVSRALLRPLDPCSLANTTQIFECNRPRCALGLRNKLLRDHMIRVLLELTLTTGQFSQAALARQGSNLLECLPTPCIPLAFAFNLLATVRFTVAIRCKVDDTQVNAKHAVHIFWCWLLNIARRKQVERPVHVDQIAFALSRVQQRALSFTTGKWYLDAPMQCQDRDFRAFAVPRQGTVIVGKRAGRTKAALRFAIQLIGIGNLRNTADEDVRGKHITKGAIDQTVQRKLLKGLSLPCQVTDLIAHRVCRLHCFKQRLGMFRGWQQFQLCDQLHDVYYRRKLHIMQMRRPFHRHLKEAVA